MADAQSQVALAADDESDMLLLRSALLATAATQALGPAHCARCSRDGADPELLSLYAPAIAFYREQSVFGLSEVLAPYTEAEVVYMVRCPRDWDATAGATRTDACQAWDALHGGYW